MGVVDSAGISPMDTSPIKYLSTSLKVIIPKRRPFLPPRLSSSYSYGSGSV